MAAAQQVLLLADGAVWMWERIPALLRRLGCPSARLICLLDFYHATQHLHEFAELAFKDLKRARAWFKKARTLLKRGATPALLQRMQTLWEHATGARKDDLTKALEFFTKRPHQLNYRRVAALKLPIGSGALESLVRQVVNLRLKGAGKSWGREHAEIVLHARCQWAAGKWVAFRDTILTAHLSPV